MSPSASRSRYGTGTRSLLRPVSRSIELHQLLEAVNARSAEFIGLAARRQILRAFHDCRGDIAHIDRLEFRLVRRRSTAGTASIRASPAKRLKKLSSGPNTMEGRRIVASGNASRTRDFAFRFRARISGFGIGIGADCGNLDQRLRAGRFGRFRNRARGFSVNGFKALMSALIKNANEVDDDVRATNGGSNLVCILDIRLDDLDLADCCPSAAGNCRDWDAARPHECGNRLSPAREPCGGRESRNRRRP